MKSTLTRLAALILAILTFGTVLASCADTNAPDITTETSADTEAPATEKAEETEPPQPKVYLTINAANAAAVSLIRSDELEKLSTTVNMFTAFRKEINKRFGSTFGIGTDFVAPGQSADEKTEILVGTTVREASVELKSKLDALDSHGFGILVRGNKIAIDGTTLYLVYAGLDYLLENLVTKDDAGNLQISLEDGFEYIEQREDGYLSPEEVMASGREMAFYSIEKLASVPKKGNYSVLQGGGTDGKYAYYAMINKSTKPETSYIHKFDMETWELVATSQSLPTAHTNDITYDSKNHRLVISYCSNKEGTTMSSPGLVFVNPDDLSFIEYIDAPTISRGLNYLPEKNQYVLAAGYTFYLTDDKFNTISSFVCGHPKLTTQGMYCDSKYIYDPRWQSGARYQTITINTLDGQFIAAVPAYNIDGEPENIFRDGNSFVMGCNKSIAVFRLMLLYKNWWE